jgi:hypothetical protein
LLIPVFLYSYLNGNRELSFYDRGEQIVPKILSIKPTCNYKLDEKGNIKFPFYNNDVRYITVEINSSIKKFVFMPQIKSKLYFENGVVTNRVYTSLILPFYERTISDKPL